MPLDDELVAGERRVGELLSASNLPALESRALLAHQLGVARERLIARPEQAVAAADVRGFAQLAERRQRGEPLAYLLGEREFYGRMFAVSPAVLIPRPETELLVEVALRLGPRNQARVLDLGTGSGCVAITLALERAEWQVTATDVSLEAIEVARLNAERWQTNNVRFRHGSWYSAAPRDQRFDLIVSNPPYVAAGDPHLDALRFEPGVALAAGDGGLACLRTIVEGALSHVVPGGILALEHGHDQGHAVRSLFAARRWRNVRTETDSAGHDRVTSASSVVV